MEQELKIMPMVIITEGSGLTDLKKGEASSTILKLKANMRDSGNKI